MLISEISLKNFKSYGNNTQSLKLDTDSGKLILIAGKNGFGKSSLLSSFDYILYNKTKGSTDKKSTTLAALPNRINQSDMLVSIKFQSDGVDVEIERGMLPDVLTLRENGVLNERAGKVNINAKIVKYVGVDLDTFKSFISMSINNFKNFISLSTEEKQILLDKLFNLEIINVLNDILKGLNKTNKANVLKYDTEINTLSDSINSIRNSIQKSLEKEKEDLQGEVLSIKNLMSSKKEEFSALKEKVEKIKGKENELKTEYDKEREQYYNIQNDIKNVQKDIDLYNLGKCPTCETSFASDEFKNLLDILLEKKNTTDKIRIEIEANIKSIKEKQTKLQGISDTTNKTFNDITYLLKNYKAQIETLEQKSANQDKNSISVQEFENSIKELNTKKEISIESLDECKEKELYYKELSKVFGEDGVKKSIIAGIIRPINHYINENIKILGLPFQVKLDETFEAEISHLGMVVDHDTLSMGELRLCNVGIYIAYMMLIRSKKHINILFLDEIFASVDTENTDKILNLLKSFSLQFNINIFVVHHALLNREMFDRVLLLEKNVFSEIKEI